MDKMCNIVRSNITYLDSFTRSMVLCYYIALSQKMDGFDRTDNLTDLLYHVGPVVYEPYLTWLLVPYFYWYTGGMQTWLSPEKWRQPHGIYKDLARALKDTISLMIVFTAVIPAAIGAILLFGIEPAMGILPGTNNPNWIEPIIAIGWFVGISLIVKWFLWPRRPWYKIPAT